MPIDLTVLCRQIDPANTVIVFGAGSSIPSGGLTGAGLAHEISTKFQLEADATLSLADVATLVEGRVGRRPLVKFVDELCGKLHATGAILNLPMFPWKDIFTTNYDTIVEQSYGRAKKPLQVLSSNFDFDSDHKSDQVSLFKFHGTVGKDRSTGHQSSIVLTNEDYDIASDYRQLLFDRLLHETSRCDVLVIGHSLSDPDATRIFNEAIARKKKAGAPGKLYALIYKPDANRAALLEQRGFSVCFATLDDFFGSMASQGPAEQLVLADLGDALSRAPKLRPYTVDVSHAIEHDEANVTQFFNGSPAKYGDIANELTFSRELSGPIETTLAAGERSVAFLLAPAGFGKTTLARQVMSNLVKRDFNCWEHKSDYPLMSEEWIKVAKHCHSSKTNSVLFIDDAHVHLRQIDHLVDHLASTENKFFRLLLVSAPNKWHARSKTPALYRVAIGYDLKRLSYTEINSLLDLFERKREISALVENTFLGFSRPERLRRLQDRCGSDMFVCLKNIFAFERLDDIILREYADLDSELQDVYRTVAAMEASNIRAHRQLVMRVLNIRSDFVKSTLNRLLGVISEKTIDQRNGIYAWRGRHQVISEIILKYKYNTQDELYRLYELVADYINPSYEIERTTINELCDPTTGIGRVHDMRRQNILYRKLISASPAQRPPRHRLIRNLIKLEDYDTATNEIRVFERTLRPDAPLIRYKAEIQEERARSTKGLMDEDRVAILNEAGNIISNGLDRWPSDRGLHTTNCRIGLEVLRYSGSWETFDAAIARLERAEKDYLDPALTRVASKFKSLGESAGHPQTTTA